MRKKLFAVIMSAMMMITFMPSMAFAATVDHVAGHLTEDGVAIENVKFSDDYTTVTADLVCGTTGCTKKYTGLSATTTRTWDNGEIKVSYDFTSQISAQFAPSVLGTDYTVTGDISSDATTYVDLAGAKITDATGALATACFADNYLESISAGATWKNSTFKVGKCPLGEYVSIVQPSYTFTTGQTEPLHKEIALGSFDDLGIVEITPVKYEAYEDNVELSIPVKFIPWESTAKTVLNAGSIEQKITVKVNDNAWNHLSFSIKPFEKYSSILQQLGGVATIDDLYDSQAAAETGDWYDVQTRYIGEDQNFKITSKGINAEYGTWDNTGKLTWSTTAPELKNVKLEKDGYYDDDFDDVFGMDIYDYCFMLKLTRGTTTKYKKVCVEIHPAVSKIGFTANNFYAGKGEKLENSDVLGLRVLENVHVDSAAYSQKAVDSYAVDSAKVKEMLNNYLYINGFTTANYGNFNLKFYADETALEVGLVSDKDSAQLCANYGLDSLGYNVPTDFEEFGLYGNSDHVMLQVTNKDNDITAVNQTKTYHVKKAKALKSNKTFQLKATADYGTLSFTKLSGNAKIKVAADGKVTVKKGLKKGKYVVKVKVKAPNAKATKKLTVKVVK